MELSRQPTAPFSRRVLTAPQQIAAAIKQSIRDGTVAPGERLPSEEALADMFGVSRPTLREALRDLRSADLLTVERGRTGGYRVTEVDPHRLGPTVGEYISLSIGTRSLTYGQLFEVRYALEVMSAGAAAQRRTDEDATRLVAAVPDPDRLPEDIDDVVALDMRFHWVLAEATHNALIGGFVSATATAFRRFDETTRTASAKQIVAGLGEVAGAVEARDSGAAAEAMRGHLAYYARHFGFAV